VLPLGIGAVTQNLQQQIITRSQRKVETGSGVAATYDRANGWMNSRVSDAAELFHMKLEPVFSKGAATCCVELGQHENVTKTDNFLSR
jgi:hypothetical protein